MAEPPSDEPRYEHAYDANGYHYDVLRRVFIQRSVQDGSKFTSKERDSESGLDNWERFK